MLAGVVEQVCGSGAAHSDELDDIITRYNEHFSDQQKLKLSGVSEAIKADFIEEKTEALKLQEELAIVTINLACMNPGSMRVKEPRQAAVEKEAWKRKRLDIKALAENTLMLATRNPIMLLRVPQKEHEHKIVNSKAKEYQQRMKAGKILGYQPVLGYL